jgi:uncharacterized protein (TIGR00255 family)
MIESMTGFGRGEVKENELEVLVEIRTLNHRFLDVALRVPKILNRYEAEIKETIRSQISRGRVEVTIMLKGEDHSDPDLLVDKALVSNYVRLLTRLKEQFSLRDSIKLEHLLHFPDIFTTENIKQTDVNCWPVVKKALESALADLKDMRLREGKEIKKDLKGRIKAIDSIIKKIEHKSKSRSKTEFDKLKKRLESITNLGLLENGRLEMEVALIADRVDVTEECIRFKSHNSYFLELLENGESAGRKLNFLLQEMHREANTIGAKANDSEISQWVVEAKDEVEKLREQIQNIE